MANIHQSPGKNNSSYSGATLSSWSRQQKIAMIAGFVLLGFLIVMSACSQQAPKSALIAVPSAETQTAPAGLTPAPAATPTPVSPVAKKKTHKKRPAPIVTYSDPNSGVSFLYPRKYELAAGEKAQPVMEGVGTVPMNFVQPGGVAVATVAAPPTSYPGTDFTTAFFNVNVNRSVSEQECSEFAFVDARDPDGEPVDAEKIQIGSVDMEKTSDFTADAEKQAESQYYHHYESGACYEFVLGLGTAGYGIEEEVRPVDRDEVFAKLEKILATVKIKPVEKAEVAAQTVTTEQETK